MGGRTNELSRYLRPVTCLYARVAGVTYENRQAAIAKLRALEILDLVPEPENAHDRHAVKVCRRTGEQIGYLRRDRARRFGEKLKLGHRSFAFVKRVSGGETHYVSITVLMMSPAATEHQVVDYINRYDVLRGIRLSLSPDSGLVASPAVDLVADVTARRREPREMPATTGDEGAPAQPNIWRRFGRLMGRLFRA